MKLVTVGPVDVPGAATLDDALDAVFGVDALRRVHGPDLVAGPFERTRRGAAERRFTFTIDATVAPPIRKFFCGDTLRVTTRQTLTKRPDAWTVVNRLKLHFVGAELFKVRPTFRLVQRDGGGVTLGGEVKHYAVLPPPLDGIAEACMAENTRRQLELWRRVLAADASVGG